MFKFIASLKAGFISVQVIYIAEGGGYENVRYDR